MCFAHSWQAAILFGDPNSSLRALFPPTGHFLGTSTRVDGGDDFPFPPLETISDASHAAAEAAEARERRAPRFGGQIIADRHLEREGGGTKV